SKHSLNEAVRRLRDRLGDHRLLTRGDAIELAGDGLSVDVLRMHEPAVARDPAKALALVRGDFLEGFTVDDAPAFEEWASHERDRQRARVAGTLVEHGERLLAASRFAEARDAGHRALAIQPFAELAVRVVMRAASLSGDSAGALSAFHDFTKRLATINAGP